MNESNNYIVKKINEIIPSDIFYDKERFTLFVYAFGCTEEQKQKIKNCFLSYIDRENLEMVYNKLTIYS